MDNYNQENSEYVNLNYISKIKAANENIKGYPSISKIMHDVPVPINSFNHDVWILNGDFQPEGTIISEDQTILVTSLFDELINIINKNCIHNDELDENFMEYLKVSADAVQTIMTLMFERNWDFDPMNKFIWIYVSLACRYEPRAIKYLMKSSYFNNNIITAKDRRGYSPLYHAITNEKFDIIMFDSYLTKENLTDMVSYSLVNLKTLEYILNKESLIGQLNCSMILLESIAFKQDAAQIILKSKTMSADILNKKDDQGVTSLIYSIIYLPSIFNDLLESEFCTSELVNEVVLGYGTILDVITKYEPKLIPVILNSKFMEKNILNNKYVFMNIYDNKDGLNEIINNQYYDPDMFLSWLPSLNILTEYAFNNLETFKLLIDHSKINQNLLIVCDSINDVNSIILGAMTNITILKIIYESSYWNDNFLKQKYKSMNIIMLLLKSNNNEALELVKELYKKKAITMELMLDIDSNDMNTFCYLCLYFPEIAIEIINNDPELHQYVKYTLKILFYNLYTKKNYELIESLISKVPITQSMINEIDDIYKNNFFMESIIFNINLSLLLLKNNLINQETLTHTNIDKDNALTLLLKHSKKKQKAYNAMKKIFDTGLINYEIINNRNIRKESPFVLACMLGNNCTKLILESEYFDMSTFANKTHDNQNCFTFACKSGEIGIIKLLCDHQLFTQEMFTSYDSLGIPYIYYAFTTSQETIKYIINHKYCNTQILNDSYKLLLLKHNIISTQLECILDSIYCTPETLLYENMDGNNCLAIIAHKNNIRLMEKLLNSNKFTLELFFHQNHNKTIFLDYVRDNKLMKLIVNSPKFDSSILSIKDKDNTTILTRLMLSHEYEILKTIIESGKCSSDDIINKTNYNDSILFNMFNLNFDIIETILLHVKLNPEDLLLKDKYGNTCLHRYAHSAFDKISGNYFKQEEIVNILEKASKILNLDICSTELFLSKNNDGDTFLLINPYLLNAILNSKYCTKELLKSINNSGTNIFNSICISHNHLFGIFVSHPLFDSSFLLNSEIGSLTKTKINMLSYICIKSLGDMLNILMESPHMTDDVINSTDEAGFTPLAYAVMTHSIMIIKILLNSKLNLEKTFDLTYPNNKSLLMLAANTSTEVLALLMESKYINENMLYTSDMYSHNIVIYAVNHSIEMTKCIMESTYWNDNLIYHCDIDDDYIMIHAGKKPEIVEYLLEKIPSAYTLVTMKNKINMTCAHYYAKVNSKSLEILLKSPKCNNDLILQKDIFGNTCLHIASKYNQESIVIITESQFATEELILIQNKDGLNALMILLLENKPSIKLFKKFGNKKLLMQKDKDGNNLLHYATRHNTKLLKIILSMDYCDSEVLNERNNDNMTCHMYACKYNGDSIQYLLDHPNTTNDMLYIGHADYGSCLTLASRYQPLAAKALLSWDKLAWKILYSIENKENFFDIACKYNSDVVKYALESKHDLSEFIDTGIPFYYACKYQPDAVKYILASEYGSRDMIFKTVDERVCLDEAYEVQPKALMNILTSKYGSEDLLFHEDEKGYKISYKIAKVFDDIATFDEIKNIKLASYDNILADDDDTDVCKICYTYKPIVIFSPCLHMSCVGCAFKLRKCHKCRTKIQNRQVKYD